MAWMDLRAELGELFEEAARDARGVVAFSYDSAQRLTSSRDRRALSAARKIARAERRLVVENSRPPCPVCHATITAKAMGVVPIYCTPACATSAYVKLGPFCPRCRVWHGKARVCPLGPPLKGMLFCGPKPRGREPVTPKRTTAGELLAVGCQRCGSASGQFCVSAGPHSYRVGKYFYRRGAPLKRPHPERYAAARVERSKSTGAGA